MSGIIFGSTSYTVIVPQLIDILVNTGLCINDTKASHLICASFWLVTINGSPQPAFAKPSIKYRLTDDPMPKANRFALFLLSRTKRKASFSTSTKPSVAITKVLEKPSSAGNANARCKAGSNSVPPPPVW